MIVISAYRLFLPPTARQYLSQIQRGHRIQKKVFKELQEQFRDQCAKIRRTEGKRLHVGQITASLGLLGLAPVAVQSQHVKEGRTLNAPIRVAPPEDEKSPEAKFDWLQFFRLLLPHFAHLLAAVATALAVAMLNIKIPQLLGDIVNVVARSGEATTGTEAVELFLAQIKEPALQMVKLYVAQSAMTFAYIYSLSCVGERVAEKMRQNLFFSILRQDVAFFDAHKSGEIMARLTSDVQDFKSSFKLCISQGLRSLTQTVGCAVSLYLISPQMTGLMLVVVPVVIVSGTCIGSFLRGLSKAAQAQVAKANAAGDEVISNIRTVRAFAMEDDEMEVYGTELSKARQLNENLGLGIGLFQGATNLFLNGIVLTTLYYGGYLLSTSSLSPGDLMSFLVATQTMQRSIAQMSLLFGNYVKGIASGARVFEYTNLEPEIPISGGKTIPFHSFKGDIEFNEVLFAYPTRKNQEVLQNFSLSVPAGKMVALVGASGGGKSTVAALLERFYDVDAGSVSIDGVDLRALDPKWLRGRAIGYINQEPVLFATSIMENIRYGRPGATDQEVTEAAKAANADNFIRSFPSGYDTVLGERGVTVSGGQKQRIAIARALVKNPSILVLDEATSALDAESEAIVQSALDDASKGRTVLVIAHRLSTIRNADVIAVMGAGGTISERGTHQELMRRGGMYADLMKQQEREEEEEVVNQGHGQEGG